MRGARFPLSPVVMCHSVGVGWGQKRSASVSVEATQPLCHPSHAAPAPRLVQLAAEVGPGSPLANHERALSPSLIATLEVPGRDEKRQGKGSASCHVPLACTQHTPAILLPMCTSLHGPLTHPSPTLLMLIYHDASPEHHLPQILQKSPGEPPLHAHVGPECQFVRDRVAAEEAKGGDVVVENPGDDEGDAGDASKHVSDSAWHRKQGEPLRHEVKHATQPSATMRLLARLAVGEWHGAALL